MPKLLLFVVATSIVGCAAKQDCAPPKATAGQVHAFDDDGFTAGETAFRLASAQKPLMLVKVMVNGQGPFEFIVDTGASVTLLATETAEKAKLTNGAAADGAGAGGAIAVRMAKLESFEIANAHARTLDVAVTDLSNLSGVLGTPIDGIVGYNFLKAYKVSIDYSASKITFAKS